MSVVGALLARGLIRPWGERFPRWVNGCAGRRMLPALVGTPALIIAALLLTTSRAVVVGMLNGLGTTAQDDAVSIIVWLPFLLWPVWAVTLALAALSYQHRRRLQAQQAATSGHPIGGRRRPPIEYLP